MPADLRSRIDESCGMNVWRRHAISVSLLCSWRTSTRAGVHCCKPSSQHACLFETEIARASFRRCADDDVIKQFDLQQFRGFGKTPRQTVVRLTWRRITGWMIMNNDYRVR